MTPIPDVPNTWVSRALPVLTSIVGHYESDGAANSEQVVDDTGLSDSIVDRSGRELRDAGFVELYFEGGGGFFVMAVTEKGRREVGAWPSPESLTDQIFAAVEERVEHADTDEERGRWLKIRDGLFGAGRDFMIGVAAAALYGSVN